MEEHASQKVAKPPTIVTDVDLDEIVGADVANESCGLTAQKGQAVKGEREKYRNIMDEIARADVANESCGRDAASSSALQPEKSRLPEKSLQEKKPLMCHCGKEVDPLFCAALCEQVGLDSIPLCRDCKAFQLLEEYVEVDKYCYSGWLFSRKKKRLRLRRDGADLIVSFWPAHRSSTWQIVVPLQDIIGVVFGAYTCTFKKQSSQNMPPHWAAFSLVAKHRTYDFAARDPEVVECCVRTFQKAICDKRTEMLGFEGSSKVLACPDLGTFDPWPLGFFLWMRLRFRLQDEANQRRLGVDHMLWIVFMKCAFLTSDERSKARFIDMAEQLRDDYLGYTIEQPGSAKSKTEERKADNRDLANASRGSADALQTRDPKLQFQKSSAEMRDLSAKIQFQKDREMAIVKDRYECRVDTFLPRAPSAVLGSPQHSKTKKGF